MAEVVKFSLMVLKDQGLILSVIVLEVSSHVWISGSFCGSSNLAAEGGEAYSYLTNGSLSPPPLLSALNPVG